MSEASSRLTAEPDLQHTELDGTVITEVLQLHPDQLTIPELILRVARNPDDGATKDKVRVAIRDLRRDGLLRYRNDDEVVTPTRTALRMYELLTA